MVYKVLYKSHGLEQGEKAEHRATLRNPIHLLCRAIIKNVTGNANVTADRSRHVPLVPGANSIQNVLRPIYR